MIPSFILMDHKSMPVSNVELISQVMTKSFPRAFTGVMVSDTNDVICAVKWYSIHVSPVVLYFIRSSLFI